jgi:hypothetical protein
MPKKIRERLSAAAKNFFSNPPPSPVPREKINSLPITPAGQTFSDQRSSQIFSRRLISEGYIPLEGHIGDQILIRPITVEEEDIFFGAFSGFLTPQETAHRLDLVLSQIKSGNTADLPLYRRQPLSQISK